MIFNKTRLKDAYLIEPEKKTDERGFFARCYCCESFAEHGIDMRIVQCSISHNDKKNTLRGMHFQRKPFEEAKLVSCLRGAICDVIVDLRDDSPSYLQWQDFELTAANRDMLYVPKGFAHGFLTLTDDTDVYYQMSEFYHPEAAAGISFRNKTINILWPATDGLIVSEADMRRDTEYLP